MLGHCSKVDLRGLAEFTSLTSLSLCWEDGEIQTVHESIANIEAALPRLTYLQSLKVGCHSFHRYCTRFDEFTQEPLPIPCVHFRAGKFQVLKYLRITAFCHLQEFDITPEDAHLGLPSLFELSIEYHQQLSIFAAGGLRADNLTILYIKGCNELSLSNTLPDCFPSLHCLYIHDCSIACILPDAVRLQLLRICGPVLDATSEFLHFVVDLDE